MGKLKLRLLTREQYVLELVQHISPDVFANSRFYHFWLGLFNFNDELGLGSRLEQAFASQEHVQGLLGVFVVLKIDLLNVCLRVASTEHVVDALDVLLVLHGQWPCLFDSFLDLGCLTDLLDSNSLTLAD